MLCPHSKGHLIVLGGQVFAWVIISVYFNGFLFKTQPVVWHTTVVSSKKPCNFLFNRLNPVSLTFLQFGQLSCYWNHLIEHALQAIWSHSGHSNGSKTRPKQMVHWNSIIYWPSTFVHPWTHTITSLSSLNWARFMACMNFCFCVIMFLTEAFLMSIVLYIKYNYVNLSKILK